MRRYLIIAIAILAAILVMSLVKWWQARRARARGEAVKPSAGIEIAHIIGALVGLAVFFAGAVLLESGASKPGTTYQPAQIKDGKISAGGFNGSTEDGN
ncbi:MAG: hypothetical protein VXZ67_02240 [Pseudomonadota bacterium]|nr:hypothetical protein [Pseudomonadota bacterium]